MNYIRQEDSEDVAVHKKRAPIIGVEVVELAPALDDCRSTVLAHAMIIELMEWNQAGTGILFSPDDAKEIREFWTEIKSLSRDTNITDARKGQLVNKEMEAEKCIEKFEDESNTRYSLLSALDDLKKIKNEMQVIVGLTV